MSDTVKRLLHSLGTSPTTLALSDADVELLLREGSEEDLYVALMTGNTTASQATKLTLKAQELRAKAA